MMKYKILFLVLLINFINVLSLEVKVSEYRDPKCETAPIYINGYSKCSPNYYWRVLENGTKIVSAKIATIDQCRHTKYSKLKFTQYENGECRLDENWGYSYKYELNLEEDPKPVKGYCNQIKYFDCNNYNIFSFLNNTCEMLSTNNYTKQVCVADKILNYECLTEDCKVDQQETDCKLVSIESTNFNKDEKCKMFNGSIVDSKELQIGLQMFAQTGESSKNHIINYLIFVLSILLVLAF
ncbi:hypothetical protein DICPUDRAFT_160382 [Dictyostelium purpureum]|uniref:Uncharacterized protein n=1 Tax=Dictyostelium purpureum TaxID=5786 RepID=F1A688_DICPU|nr:uncharacterized protein DICPUDRAFT_160382 [Dictyostelium purpureum]EGC28293.1 hypothetical protein DICPUDRAFT_160382 [Dictyostelium purpureum]|eukprot:XP_003295182.1 hypothetical protein DICPUDRAFT_160382 [Dictyostelium purpureum]